MQHNQLKKQILEDSKASNYQIQRVNRKFDLMQKHNQPLKKDLMLRPYEFSNKMPLVNANLPRKVTRNKAKIAN